MAALCCLLSLHGHSERLGSWIPTPPRSWPLLHHQEGISQVKVRMTVNSSWINATTNFLNATVSDNKFPSCFNEQSRSDLEREEKHPSLMFSDKGWD